MVGKEEQVANEEMKNFLLPTTLYISGHEDTPKTLKK